MKSRQEIPQAKRIVIKIGSSSLTGKDGTGLNKDAVEDLVSKVAALRSNGKDVVVVSSGAIAAGLAPLGLSSRPKDLSTQQAAAAVGQGLLLHRYTEAFNRFNLVASQVLLTIDDVIRRSHYQNAQRTLFKLLQLGVVPIINENDSVGTQEIRFGDNDRLAALVCHLIGAELLVIISDVDGLYDSNPNRTGAKRINLVSDIESIDTSTIGGSVSKVGSGGMITKVEAARIATEAGIAMALTSLENLSSVLEGKESGTFFAASSGKKPSRLLWLEHASTPRGRLILDSGAVTAIRERGVSLLPAGVTKVEGEFRAGDPIELCAPDNQVFARGLVGFDSDEIPKLLGRSTKDLARELGPEFERELVHRDDLVLL